MTRYDGCQLPGLPRAADGMAAAEPQSFIQKVKRSLAVPWNYHVKKWLKRAWHAWSERGGPAPASLKAQEFAHPMPLQTGDLVRVRSRQEIASTLDPFDELKGCAFLEGMYRYCDTEQRVFKVMQRFLDERDYKVKKVRGIILLENVFCEGTPAFGACDRSCLLFWREEWLERIS